MNYRLLESAATTAAREAGVSDETWRRFLATLRPLRDHHEGMYAHSLRVGLYAHGIAVAEGQDDRRLPLLGGCGHDLGKCMIPVEVLDKTEPLTAADLALFDRHPEAGHSMLTDEFPMAAMIAGLHHAFQKRPYGIGLDDAPHWMGDHLTPRIIEATLLVMVCDCWDALTTRRNNATRVDPDDVGAVLGVMRETFGDQPRRLGFLSTYRIGSGADIPTGDQEVHVRLDRLH